ncbi:MAG: aminotransferase class III-fold pyridoxal phosphate-dependent enzyme [Desulfobacterota bacterium]|nr:aminotransferase class III-fold pyridoxal phosphate-dependent enzyme [Thermodesulfobacteriota bacterium]
MNARPRNDAPASQCSVSQLLELESQYCSYGDTVHYADEIKIFDRSEGIYLYDKEGVAYLDMQMWYSAVNFGYGNKRHNDALKRQLDKLPQLACQYLHEEKILLATKIAQRIQKTFNVKGRVHFNVGGSAAIEDSLKIVRKHTGKNLVFAFMGSYHGRTLAASEITSSYRYREPFGHFSNRAYFIPYPYCFRCFFGKKRQDCGLYCLHQFEKLFESEYYTILNKKNDTSEFAAFYIEPLQGTGGYIIPPPEYFRGLKNVLDRYSILLVDDEVQMGIFRTGKFWAIEHLDITPDVIVFGKALTNGLNPISGIWAREELISPKAFPAGMTHSTFSSNPLGTAIGLETMKIIAEEEPALLETIPRKGKYFADRIRLLQKKYPQIGDVDSQGLVIRIEMCHKDGYTPNRELTDAMTNIGLSGKLEGNGKRMGIIFDVGGYYKNVFTLSPSFYITEQELDLAADLFEQALRRGLQQIG